MKRLLLILAVILFVNKVSAQLVDPVTGTAFVCVADSTALSDATPGGMWSSSNVAIASVGSATGVVKGIMAGFANITYSVGANYVIKLVTVNPLPFPITGVSSICTGSTALFTDAPAGGTWSSSTLTVALVSPTTGLVTATTAGNDTIIYTLPTGCIAKYATVIKSIAISGPSTACLGSGPITLSDATAGGTWSSSDPAIATIGASSGVLTGISAGSVVVNYSAGAACSGAATVAVRPVPTITPSPVTGCVGSSKTLSGSPSGGSWGSSAPAIASINIDGVVSAIAAGSAVITYTGVGGCVNTTNITINPDPLPITGINYVYTGPPPVTTTLTDPTGGGAWSSSNTTLATVDPATGIVTGFSAGLVVISYAIPSTGCAAIYRVEVDPLPATTNLQAWYPFCGDTIDHSGPNGSDGGHELLDYLGTPATLTADRFGNPNSAYLFGGGNSFMEYSTYFPNSGIPNDFTYSCWIYPTVNQSSIILYNGDPNTDGFGFVMNDGSGFPGLAGNEVAVLFGGVGQFNPTPLPALNTWYNLVLVKNGNSYHFYVNAFGSSTLVGTFFIATFNPMSVGSVFALANNETEFNPPAVGGFLGFNGAIDDIAIINRQLTTPERTSLFNFNPDAINFTLGPADTTICSDFMNLSPNPQTVGGLYTWQANIVGSGWVTIDTTDTLITVYPVAGLPLGNPYSLTITKPYGCISAASTTVYKAPIPVDLGPPQQFCIGDTITLSTYFSGATYLWSTGDTTDFIKVTTTGTYYVTVDSVHHYLSSGMPDSVTCVGRDTVYVNASPPPVITLPATVANCQGNPDTVVTFYDASYTYEWSNGRTNDTGILATSGIYWVKVSNGGCSLTDTTVATVVADTFTLLSPDTAVCRGDKVPANATVNSLVSYQWTPTTGISVSNIANTTIATDSFNAPTEIYLTVSYPGCVNLVDSFHIDVQPVPNVYIGGNRNVCEGDTLHITANVTPSWYTHYTFDWTPVNANLDSMDTSTVIFTALTRHDSEELIVKVYPPVYLSVPADSECYAMDSGAIFVHPRFNDTIASQFNLCPGDSVQLIPNPDSLGNALGVIVSASNWSPGVYLNDSNAIYPWVHPITSVEYKLVAYSQYGCADTLFTNINVYPAAVINLGDSVIISPGQSHQISPQTNCATFLWFPPLGLDNIYVSNPVATPVVSTTYIVNAATEDGCMVTDSIRIHVDPGTLIAIPNAFTPGAGVNSLFMIIPKGAVGLNYFRIFDRWGNKVYESNNIEAGWDGKFNGQPQPFGVYVYDVEAVTSTGEIFHREGNVTLIR